MRIVNSYLTIFNNKRCYKMFHTNMHRGTLYSNHPYLSLRHENTGNIDVTDLISNVRKCDLKKTDNPAPNSG